MRPACRPASTSRRTSRCSRPARHRTRRSRAGSFSIDGEVDESRQLELGRVPRAAERGDHRRHPLRDEVVEARHGLARRLDRHAARRRASTAAEFVIAFGDGGYTTNLPLEDVTDGKAWIVYEYDGEPLAAEHGGPARLLVPHLYFWKSAKWVRGLRLQSRRTSRASGSRTATTTTVTRGRSSGTGATDLAARGGRRRRRRERARRRRSRSTCPSGPGTGPASTSTCG